MALICSLSDTEGAKRDNKRRITHPQAGEGFRAELIGVFPPCRPRLALAENNQLASAPIRKWNPTYGVQPTVVLGYWCLVGIPESSTFTQIHAEPIHLLCKTAFDGRAEHHGAGTIRPEVATQHMRGEFLKQLRAIQTGMAFVAFHV